jgi:hypothetical protein
VTKDSKPAVSLRTAVDLVSAHEWLFERQKNGEIDAKTADALNTTLKGSMALLVKYRLDAAKIVLQAAVKKVSLPERMLPDLTEISLLGK